MTISYIGAQGAAATTVTIPSHQIGDLILIFAYRDGNNAVPTAPSAGGTVPTWNLIGSSGGNTNSSQIRWARATATNTTSGTWTNATELICVVYRGAAVGSSIGGSGSATTTVNYPALVLERTDGSSWVTGFAGHRTATNVDVAPSGMTNRAFAGTEAAAHDTNGTVTSWSSTDVTVNASSAYRSWVVELIDQSVVLAAAARSFSVTGVAASLKRGRTLNSEPGPYSLALGNASIKLGRSLAASTGSLNVSGVTTLLEYGRILAASSGTFTLTGNVIDIHIVSGVDFNVDQGHVDVIGNPVNLRVDRRLSANSGALLSSGQASLFGRTFVLVASTRAFNVNGVSIPLVYSGGAPVARKLYYQSVSVDPRKDLINPTVSEDQLVYYINNFFRIL